MADELKRTSKLEKLGMEVTAAVTGSAPVFKFVEHVDHLGSAIVTKKGETSVENLYNHDGYINKAPAIAKNWTDYRDLPRPPKEKDTFREWFKHHQAQKEGK